MIENILSALSNSKMFMAFIMILNTIGGRYITSEMSKYVEIFLNKPWIRRTFIFGTIFLVTRDIKVALFMTLVFVIFFNFFLNDKSKLCLIPKKIQDENDPYKNGVITLKDIENAEKILSLKKKMIKNSPNKELFISKN